MTALSLVNSEFVALIDDCDFHRISRFRWKVRSIQGKIRTLRYAYAFITINKKQQTLFLHHAIVGKARKPLVIDHKDRDGLNNQKHNLRKCTRSQNQANRISHRKFKGVWTRRRKVTRPWRANIQVNGKAINLGNYSTEIEAAKAYNEGALKYFGEFALLNKL
jgi:hypothetical protein